MALEWLDAARYADTNGYSIDGGRQMWLWRDWVIDAFKSNLPYDQFLVEQLAGDLLPDRSPAQLIASGFQRNNMVTHEGGTIPAENLANYNADRVKTLGEAVLGLTVGCAQCHDHKYDPITQRDYFRLFAYFNTASDIGLDGDGGVNPRPLIEAQTVLQTDEIPALQQRSEEIRQALSDLPAELIAAWVEQQRAALAERGRKLELHPAQLRKISTPNAGGGFAIEGDRYVTLAGGGGPVAYDVSMQLPRTAQPISGLRIVFHPRGPAGSGWGFGKLSPEDARETFVMTTFSASAEAVPGDQVNLNLLRPIRSVTANSWRKGYRPEHVLDTRPTNGWSPDVSHDGTVHLTVTFAEPLDAMETPFLTAQVHFGQRGPLLAGRFEFQAVTGQDDGSPLPTEMIAIVAADPQALDETQRLQLNNYIADHAEQTWHLRVELANLQERLQTLNGKFPTMVMDVAAEPRETFLLERGNYAAPGEKVTAGTPAFLPPLPEGAPANRLGLAEWIIAPEHPLTARVAVNRVWKILFGAGLVRTPADFGFQGEWPSHPELLDWLAVEFVADDWNTKTLVRKIVLSATYRQSSATSNELLERDPENRLLARGPRFRLDAELIRDAALKVSGLLVDRLGGPSVNPYTPGDLWREVSHYGSTPATAQTFSQDHGEKLYRRSLYTYWKRSVPPPNMAAFDAPTRETCVAQRPSTITPLQALVLLNDVQFVEASRAFAERILAQETSDLERLRWAFEECLSRPPRDGELAVLAEWLASERTRYRKDEQAAGDFLSAGESLRDASIPASEHAAWSQVAALLLNLSETITRN
jgi:hypothetical protein